MKVTNDNLSHPDYNPGKLLSRASRIAKLVVAFFATLLVIPFCCYPTLINRCWAEGFTGRSQQKVALIRFGDARARPFHTDDPTAEVAKVASIELGDGGRQYTQSGPSDEEFERIMRLTQSA